MGEPPLKWCNTCRFLRPPRTHHCRVCDICVVRFDHHCVWLNTCPSKRSQPEYRQFLPELVYTENSPELWVSLGPAGIGASNLRWFLAFVSWHAVLCGYGVVFVFCLLRTIARQLSEGDPMVLEWLGQRRFAAYMRFIPKTWGMVGQAIGNVEGTNIPWAVVWATNVPLMVLLIFCVVMGAVLGSFFALHVCQVFRNQTSYEGWTFQPNTEAGKEGKDGAEGDADAAAESCKTPPAPSTGTGKAEEKGDDATAAADGKGEDEEQEEDRGTRCRIKREAPKTADGEEAPIGQCVSTQVRDFFERSLG